jgi:hypothetical protein
MKDAVVRPGCSPLLLAAALTLAGALPVRAADRPSFNRHTGLFEPPLTELSRAVEQGDRAEIARWATRIGPARLASALRGPDRASISAALEAVPLLPGSVRLLESVTALVTSSDAGIAEKAARALGQMLDGSEPRWWEDWDVPADSITRACRALADSAQSPAAAQPVRLAALDALAEASGSCAPPSLGPLVADAVPAVRRAALLAMRPRDELSASDLQRALADPDPTVVSAAAVCWCRRRLAHPTSTSAVNPPLRNLVSADSTPVEDALELIPCLAASKDAGDRQALDQLRRSSKVPLLKARAGEVVGEK